MTYLYALANPATLIDPDGHSALECDDSHGCGYIIDSETTAQAERERRKRLERLQERQMDQREANRIRTLSAAAERTDDCGFLGFGCSQGSSDLNTWDVTATAAEGAWEGTYHLAEAGTRAGQGMHRADAAVRSASGQYLSALCRNPTGTAIGRAGRAFAGVGRYIPGVGYVVTAATEFTEEGNDPGAAIVETGVDIVLSTFVGTIAIAAFCGATAGIGCLVAAAGGYVVGGAIAQPLGDILTGTGG